MYRLFLCLIILFLPFFSTDAAGKKERHAPIASAVNNMGIVPTIVIDAGHGGVNLGARGQNPYCEEKRFTLLTARYVKKYLSQLGYRVIMTRSTDVFIPLTQRVETANKVQSDLFVSIHFNASRIPMAQGIEVFFSEKTDKHRSVSSHRLARSILTRIVRRTQSPSRGVKKAEFYVIRETEMPAVLVEGGFISNVSERKLLKNPAYIEKIARGIVEGIDFYFKKSS